MTVTPVFETGAPTTAIGRDDGQPFFTPASPAPARRNTTHLRDCQRDRVRRDAAYVDHGDWVVRGIATKFGLSFSLAKVIAELAGLAATGAD
jgi:hypothetical protein